MKSLRIKKTVTSSIELKELEPFIGKEVEIIIREQVENADEPPNRNAAGMLEKFKDTAKFGKEDSAWHKAVKDKHGIG